jgi:hypothetical protein
VKAIGAEKKKKTKIRTRQKEERSEDLTVLGGLVNVVPLLLGGKKLLEIIKTS